MAPDAIGYRRVVEMPPECGEAPDLLVGGLTGKSISVDRGSASLAVSAVAPAPRAELRQLETIGIVAAVLLRDVVALLALHAGESDLRANVAALAGHFEVLRSLLRRVW
jgi:hypothetical protein